MRPDDPNYEYLLLIADALGELRNDVVFVGGCTAGLLLTDRAWRHPTCGSLFAKPLARCSAKLALRITFRVYWQITVGRTP